MLKSGFNKLIKGVAQKFFPGRLVLMYHRINDDLMDPWKIRVKHDNFHNQIAALRMNTNVVPLEELLFSEKLPERSIAVTFDDGYADNLYLALPVLKEYNVPATFFISTGQINSSREFWWDELENIILNPGILPENLSLTAGGKKYEWNLGDASVYSEAEYRDDAKEKVWLSKEGTRLNFYYSIWQVLFPLQYGEKIELLNRIRRWSNRDPEVRHTHRPMTTGELLQLSGNDLCQIGAHGMHHMNLVTQKSEDQAQEISGSKRYLEQLLPKRKITGFAFPHGEYDNDLISILKDLDFTYALTTDYGSFRRNSNLYKIPRFQVEDLDQDSFLKCTAEWFSS